MLKIFLFLYQWLIAFPILLFMTAFTAIFTVCTMPWKNSEPVHKVQQLWSRLFFWLFFMNAEVEGEENLVPGQSYVFVSNHQSLFDVWLIYGWLPVIFKWIMKAELRKVPFIGFGCAAAGHIFIERTHLKQAKHSIEKAKQTLTGGVSVVVFPEGTRSADGKVQEFKAGAFQVALDLDLPVVPLTLIGPYNVLPRNAALVRPAQRVKLVIGKPVDITPYIAPDDADRQTKKEMQHQAMELLRSEIITTMEREDRLMS
ncbi:MAG: 1-acyl-sn-glycerol-3-phosphate acyltransferase [Paludibacteraceae bacterium]|nr:1-acyl-sn-glycerol-3-phosphate acyltransferase [Paludibacteraceae bacterium]